MRLIKFDSIRYGVFRDFTWSADLKEFAGFNLIYSPNGSGKSTLAEILRHWMKAEPLTTGATVCTTDEGSIKIDAASAPSGFENLIRVYDPDYRSRALDSFDGIRWSIGKEAVDAATELAGLKNDIEADKTALTSAKSEKSADVRALESFLEEAATDLRTLKRLLPGQTLATYSKAVVRSDLEAFDPKEKDKLSLSKKEDETHRTLLFDRKVLPPVDVPSRIGPVDLTPLFGSTNELQIAATSGVAEVPPEIAEHQRWLSEGLDYLKAGTHGGCPFCRQDVPADRKQQLEESLGTKYQDLARDVAALRDRLPSIPVEIDLLGIPNSAAILATQRDAFDAAVIALGESLTLHNQAMADMGDRLSLIAEGRETEDPPPLVYEGTAHADWAHLKSIISAHNAEVSDHERVCTEAFAALRGDILSNAIDRYHALVGATQSSDSALTGLHSKLVEHTAQLHQTEARAQRIDHAVDVLNADLAAYLGHPHICVEVLDDGYQILREGVAAATVSEGERTAITFLHFLRSLDDEEFQREEGLVVIDDPVSSLDSTALHSAAAFLMEAIHDRDANRVRGQVLVTTHNFAFFRLLRDWTRHLKKDPPGDGDRTAARFYSIHTAQTAAGRSSTLTQIDPLLLRFNSEYHFLFSKVHGYSEGGDEALYVLNLARRLVEAFLAFRVPGENAFRLQLDELLEEVESIGSEQQQRLRMLFNTGSHTAAIPDVADPLGQIDEVPAAIAAVMDLIRAGDSRHFDRMVALCSPSGGTD